jgi:NAD-dependent SIR2 family protein deacetylase
MKYYFYCPHCGNQYIVDELPKKTMANCRDGYGAPIYHYECNKCHNLDAGFMYNRNGALTKDDIVYFRSVISMYQNVRGFRIFN